MHQSHWQEFLRTRPTLLLPRKLPFRGTPAFLKEVKMVHDVCGETHLHITCKGIKGIAHPKKRTNAENVPIQM